MVSLKCSDMATIVEQILKKPDTAKPVVQDTVGTQQPVPANNGVEPAKPSVPQKSAIQPLTDKPISPVQVASKSVVQEKPLLQTQQMTMTDIYQKLNPYTPPSQEQLEKERRRDKASRIISAIGDGIGALSNLYFTTKGAPSVQISPSNTLSGVYKKRYDELTAKRKEERDKWVAGYLNAAGQDRVQGNADRSHEFQKERAKEQDKKQTVHMSFRLRRLTGLGNVPENRMQKINVGGRSNLRKRKRTVPLHVPMLPELSDSVSNNLTIAGIRIR